MPNPARRPCPYCSGYQPCAQHKVVHTQRTQGQRGDRDQAFYNSARWRQTSHRHRLVEPFCRQCATDGRVSLATMTDHIKPMRLGGDPWDPTNHQSLCRRCHAQKRAREMRESLG